MKELLKWWWFKLFGATCPKGHPLRKRKALGYAYSTRSSSVGDYVACDICRMAWEIRKPIRPLKEGQLVTEKDLESL